MKKLLLVAAVAAAPVAAQEMVTLSPRPGVKQSFFVANMGGVKPQAIAAWMLGKPFPPEIR